MDNLYEFLFSPLPLVAIVALVVYFRRKNNTAKANVGLVVRRLFEFGFFYVLIWIVSIGAGLLLSELFEVINDGSSNDTEEIALGMTFFLVGGVGLSAHIVWLRRRFSRNSNEKLSAGWWICTSAIELSALVVGIFASIEVLKWVIASDQFSASALSALLVVKIIWFANWFYTKELREYAPDRIQFNYLTGSSIGSVGLGVSLFLLINNFTQWLYDGISSSSDTEELVVFDDFVQEVPLIIVFIIVWWWYWWRNGRQTDYTIERHAYILIVGVLGGLAALITAGSGVLFTLFSWIFVDQKGTTALEHFHSLPEFGSLLVTGFFFWGYYRRELPRSENRNEVIRTYEYLSAWVGLTASIVGLAILVSEVIVNPVVPGSNSSLAEPLVAVVTLLLVGGLVWWHFWFRIQVHSDSDQEKLSTVRRVYLFTVFGSTALAVLISLLILVFKLVNGILAEELDSERVGDLRVPLSVIISTVGVAIYHRQFLRLNIPDNQNLLKKVFVVSSDPSGVVVEIKKELDINVEAFKFSQSSKVTGISEGDVISTVNNLKHTTLLILNSDDGSFEVIPLEDSQS